jgi:hypothetical protein
MLAHSGVQCVIGAHNLQEVFNSHISLKPGSCWGCMVGRFDFWQLYLFWLE